MFQLQNKVAVITGAGSGMGRADAILLASQGAKVAVTGRHIDTCKEVVQTIESQGGQAVSIELDVSSSASVETAFDKVIEHFGRVDILVNNAGVFESKAALDLSEEEWENLLAINLKGQFLCAQRAAREMQKNKWGRIINISSIASGGVGIGIAGAVHYTASKGGIIGMTETLAVEWAPLGITVNTIAPGAIDTPMLRGADSASSADFIKTLLKGIPLGRVGKPEEIAAAVVFLASEEASYISGVTLFVDGGWQAM